MLMFALGEVALGFSDNEHIAGVAVISAPSNTTRCRTSQQTGHATTMGLPSHPKL